MELNEADSKEGHDGNAMTYTFYWLLTVSPKYADGQRACSVTTVNVVFMVRINDSMHNEMWITSI